MDRNSINLLLKGIIPTTSEGADAILDLRELLLADGHPGKCVKCFFNLAGNPNTAGSLAPLRHWLEQHIEVLVAAADRVLETLPVNLSTGEDLDSFCQRAIEMVRHDRSYEANQIILRFQYSQTAPA